MSALRQEETGLEHSSDKSGHYLFSGRINAARRAASPQSPQYISDASLRSTCLGYTLELTVKTRRRAVLSWSYSEKRVQTQLSSGLAKYLRYIRVILNWCLRTPISGCLAAETPAARAACPARYIATRAEDPRGRLVSSILFPK
ncbi:hypothetical protein AXG93_1660s1650 [Marchantia polymorpha subsp. ruderalis]|uniref:Uncharacterized protein n=1 Tax=Marchantia polymorpha subsp. ruderalis TaxID=1480154 RepID=A0A176VTG3_MARPO|nr:hypothetical protein AXG93_1660s1650 [Marchantia polymorpha subsp. ruderalis]